MLRNILVTADNPELQKTIAEVVDELGATTEFRFSPVVDEVISIQPVLIIVDADDDGIGPFFASVGERKETSEIPFLFLVAESERWLGTPGFRNGIDSKVAKESPKEGLKLRLQAVLRRAEISHALAKSETALGMSPDGRNASGKTEKRSLILLVEDDEPTRFILQNAFNATAHSLIVATNGVEGLDLAQRTQPDIIISDYMMPVMDGLEFLQRLRGMNHIPYIPFVFLTAKSQFEDRIVGLETGADEYLAKPFSIRELLLRVERLIDFGRKRRISEGVLNGRLSDVGLADVFQMVSQNRKTGSLLVDSDSCLTPFSFEFSEGNLVRAACGHCLGIKAFHRALTLEDGLFAFQNLPLSNESNIDGPLDNLLLDGYTLMDESRQRMSELFRDAAPALRTEGDWRGNLELSVEECEVLNAVDAVGDFQAVLDAVNLSDFVVMDLLCRLKKLGFVREVEAGEAA
jgi:DNA-binding response OmpR family regulator